MTFSGHYFYFFELNRQFKHFRQISQTVIKIVNFDLVSSKIIGFAGRFQIEKIFLYFLKSFFRLSKTIYGYVFWFRCTLFGYLELQGVLPTMVFFASSTQTGLISEYPNTPYYVTKNDKNISFCRGYNPTMHIFLYQKSC